MTRRLMFPTTSCFSQETAVASQILFASSWAARACKVSFPSLPRRSVIRNSSPSESLACIISQLIFPVLPSGSRPYDSPLQPACRSVPVLISSGLSSVDASGCRLRVVFGSSSHRIRKVPACSFRPNSLRRQTRLQMSSSRPCERHAGSARPGRDFRVVVSAVDFAQGRKS